MDVDAGGTGGTGELVSPVVRGVIKNMGDERLGVAEAQGVRFVDVNGKSYIDATSSEWVLNLGYRHPEVHDAIRAQLDRIEFVTPVFESEPRSALAERLAEITPGDLSRVAFATSGADAVEGAMHLAIRGTGGSDFVCLDQAFHGRTFGTIGLSYSYPMMLEGSNRGLDRYLTRQLRTPNYNCYRCPLNLERETCDLACAELIDYQLERGHTHGPAGVIVEVVQANGGMVPAPDGWLPRVQEICRSREVPLIVDEIQTGLCRCGSWTGSEHFGIEPDIIVLGKALGAGLPLTAAVASPRYGELLAWEYGYTQQGNTLACAASLAMLNVMERDDLCANATRIGEVLSGRLREIGERSRLIADVRGPGLMIGVELVRDRATREPADDEAAALFSVALDRGLLIGKSGPVFGPFGNVMKFKPAVNTTEAEAHEMADRFADALAEVEKTFR